MCGHFIEYMPLNIFKHIKRLTLVCCLGLAPFVLKGQWSIGETTNYSLKDGLSDRAVRDITQDEDGFVWIATNNGLNRFDGYRFLVFDNNENTDHQIAQSRIHDLELLANNQLGLFNEDNLEFFEILNPQNFTSNKIQLNEANGLRGRAIDVYFTKRGSPFVLTIEDKVYRIYEWNEENNFQLKSEHQVNELPNLEYLSFVSGQSGNNWIWDNVNGLMKFNPKGQLEAYWDMDQLEAKTSNSEVTYYTEVFFEDMNGNFWAALPFRAGILKIPSNTKDLTYHPGLPQSETYFKLWEDHKGNISTGTFLAYWKIKDLFQIKTNGEVSSLNGLVEIQNTISCIFKPEKESLLFMGTYVGTYKVDIIDDNIDWLLAERQLNDTQWDDGISIRGITGDETGNIFISRELSAWYQTNESLDNVEEIILYDERGEKIELWCCSNVVIDKGILWGGSCLDDRDGLFHRYDTRTKQTKSFQLPSKTIRHLAKGKDGQFIMVTGAEGFESKLLFFDIESEKITEYRNGDGSNPLNEFGPQYVAETKNGNLWVGTTKGLIFINTKEGISQTFLESNSQLTNDDITSILELENGTLMLGSHGGLSLFNPSSGDVQTFNTSHGLSNNIVANVLPDGEGGYWLPTYYGLSHFYPEEELFSTFYKEKGLTFNEFNRMAYYRDGEDKFYLGTINGINIFRNQDLKEAPFSSISPHWTGIDIYRNGTKRNELMSRLNELESLKLSHDDDLVKLEFCLPVFENSNGNRFAAKLEGRDTSWQFLGSQAFYELNNPQHGKYKLRIKAIPYNGMISKNELTIDIEVSQVYYQTMWFIIGMPLVLLGIVYLISRWYISRIKKQEEVQTKINKRFAELELQALQSQMNPHFVFNSLGAIQYFIQDNNQKAADEYLAKFAKLMRLFLESSKNKYISLDEEIKLLSLYIELEQMRFEDKFDAEVKVNENLDVYDREIPSILIQPFIENAINHGLFNKEGKGMLKIIFSEDEKGNLACVVEDNGIGRKKAEALKKESSRNYKSRGMQIVEERLEVLQQVDDVKINVSVKDLHPDQSDTGTVVIIEIQDFD